MRKRTLSLIAFFSLSLLASAFGEGQSAAPLGLTDLRTPMSPAAVLTGVSPSLIESPESPSAFIGSAVKALSGEASGLCLEVAPYWWWPHADLSFEGYYHPGLLQCLAQNAALSLLFDSTEGIAKRVTCGLKTLILQGQVAAPADSLNLEGRWHSILVMARMKKTRHCLGLSRDPRSSEGFGRGRAGPRTASGAQDRRPPGRPRGGCHTR